MQAQVICELLRCKRCCFAVLTPKRVQTWLIQTDWKALLSEHFSEICKLHQDLSPWYAANMTCHSCHVWAQSLLVRTSLHCLCSQELPEVYLEATVLKRLAVLEVLCKQQALTIGVLQAENSQLRSSQTAATSNAEVQPVL